MEWITFVSAQDLVISFSGWLQLTIKLMKAVLVRRSAELAYWSRRG